MKKAILLFLLLPMLASAQYFDVFDIDTSEYPIMKAKFYSIDANGKQILNHTPTDFEITENGEPRDVISVSCPIPKDDPFSVVIALDVSGSMKGERISSAINAIKEFVNLVPNNGSEIAIIAFNNSNYYISDFTRNKTQLLSKIDALNSDGGTNFNAAFLNPLAGSLLAIDKAKHQNRSVLLITDGYASGNQTGIINEALNYNASINSIIIETAVPEILSNISDATGGKVYSNIITEAEFNEAFINISYNLLLEPCLITWEANLTCEYLIKLNINHKVSSLASTSEYIISDYQALRLASNPYFISFGLINKRESKDTLISLTSFNSDNTIVDVVFEPDNGFFKVLNPLPILLEKDESVNLSIRYNAIETTKQYSKLKLISDYCEHSIGLLGGNNNQRLAQRTLGLTFPNGSEIFSSGVGTIITWSGISEQEDVRLRFSSNNGKDWTTITKSTSDLKDNWKVPYVNSDSCLININLLTTEDKPTAIEWSEAYGGTNLDIANNVVQTNDGGCILVGYSRSNDEDLISTGNKGLEDYWILKVDNSGVIEWSKTYGGSELDIAKSVFQTRDGGYIIAGYSQSTDYDLSTIGNKGAKDYWVLKLGNSGDIEWSKTYGGSRNEEANSIVQTQDGGYILAGRSTSNDGDVNIEEVGFDDYWLLKLGSSGDIEWSKTYGGSEFEIANSIIQTSDTGYLVAGNSRSNDGDLTNDGNKGNLDAWIIKLNNSGETEWSKSYGGSQNDMVNKVIQTTDNSFIVIGHSVSNDADLEITGNKGKLDYWILKLGISGDIEWSKTYGGSEDDIAESVIQTQDGGYIVAGNTSSNNGDLGNINRGGDDYWFIKLNSNGEMVWTKTYGGTQNDEVVSIIQTENNGYIVVGNSTSNDGDLKNIDTKGNGDSWLIKFTPPLPLQSDTSDAVFSIIMPEPVIQNNDIDMGQMIVGNTKDTIVSSVLCNVGDAPLHVLGVDITDAFNSEDFLIPRGAGDFYLEKGDCQDMMFEFTPSALGNRTAVATIRTTIGDFTDTINIRGAGIAPVIEATADVVDFGVFELEQGKDTNVVLVKNIGSNDIIITDTRISGPDMEQFTLNTTPVTYTIPAGQEKEFELNYTAKYGGRTSSILEFHYNGIGSPLRSMLFAEGIGGEVYPQVPDAYVGETVELGIFLGKIKPEGLREVATNFTATVSYNSTLLAPIDKSMNVSTEFDKSYINISGQLSSVAQIAAIPMKVGLGTADRSGLVITEFQLFNANGDSVDYDIEPGVGEFNVLGICEEGGQRLLNPDGDITTMKLLPNRTSGQTTVELTLIESGQTELTIFDQIGNKIETVYSGNPDIGTQEITLDLSNYANGRYYVKLTTPTITKTEILEVVR